MGKATELELCKNLHRNLRKMSEAVEDLPTADKGLDRLLDFINHMEAIVQQLEYEINERKESEGNT